MLLFPGERLPNMIKHAGTSHAAFRFTFAVLEITETGKPPGGSNQ